MEPATIYEYLSSFPGLSKPMHTAMVRVSAHQPQPVLIAAAAAVLRAGGLVAFPTETVYGLGASALDPEAVRRIFAAKDRPVNNPLIVHAASAAEAKTIVAVWPDAADQLTARFWPGPLTLVLPKQPHVPDEVTGGGPTVAVRVPAHPVARALIEAAGRPIAAPSANRSSGLSPTRAEHVAKDLNGRIDMILDGGPTPGGLESTVLDLVSAPPRLLRPGLVGPAAIEAVIGSITRPRLAVNQGPLPSPGMLPRHYAPRAQLKCMTGDAREQVESLCRRGLRVGWLTPAPKDQPHLPGLTVMLMPAQASAYAACLYAVLHELDDAGVDRIVVDMPPDTDDWLPVRDRLQRAASDS